MRTNGAYTPTSFFIQSTRLISEKSFLLFTQLQITWVNKITEVKTLISINDSNLCSYISPKHCRKIEECMNQGSGSECISSMNNSSFSRGVTIYLKSLLNY